MTDPTFTPDFPLLADAGGLVLEGTELSFVSSVKRTWRNRRALLVSQITGLTETKVRVFTVSAEDPKNPEPPSVLIDATKILFSRGTSYELSTFAHPYADVKRIWTDYLRGVIRVPGSIAGRNP